MVKRKTNNRFAVIDFETANGYRETVCSVGVVIVENCKIVDKFYSLINPQTKYLKNIVLLLMDCNIKMLKIPLNFLKCGKK